MSTVADCPDDSQCPRVPHGWTPEPAVIHKPRLCLRGLRRSRNTFSDRELLRDFAGWLGNPEPTDEELDRYIAGR